MKAKKFLALSMALVTVTAVSTVAFAKELTDTTPTGETEVTAKIKDPGAVSYTITIPDKVDFGNLTQPQTNTDSFKDVNYEVTATSIENLPSTKSVLVHVKDKNATVNDDKFYITQKTSPNTKLTYDVYETSPIEEGDNALADGEMNNDGYLLVSLKKTGDKLTGTLRLNEKQLYGKNISEIAGDYSGYMVFTSSIS